MNESQILSGDVGLALACPRFKQSHPILVLLPEFYEEGWNHHAVCKQLPCLKWIHALMLLTSDMFLDRYSRYTFRGMIRL